jgi:hypothetical protein
VYKTQEEERKNKKEDFFFLSSWRGNSVRLREMR